MKLTFVLASVAFIKFGVALINERVNSFGQAEAWIEEIKREYEVNDTKNFVYKSFKIFQHF